MKVLIAGGAGYIGSTIVSACADSGIQPIILDNLVTGRREFTQGHAFYEGDISDGALVGRILAEHPDIHTVIHCAALIVVPESVADPLRYYRENVAKTISFLSHLAAGGCERVLFSSSASLYRPDPSDFSVDEDSPLAPDSPYARTKLMIETVLEDAAHAGNLRVVSLRYFNPIGADPKGRTGLQGRTPTHALGVMIESWKRGEPFPVTGVQWPTRDGSGIRDYVHVWDLARAHVLAVQRFDAATTDTPYQVINLGTGNGTTVRELAEAFSHATESPLPVVELPARPGDAAGAYARTDRARRLLEWEPELTLADGIRDALNWAEHRDLVLGQD